MMKGSKEAALLHPKMSPLLLFHYNYCPPVEESDDDKNFSDQEEPEEEEEDDNASHEEEESDDDENFSDQDEPDEEEEDDSASQEGSDDDENFSDREDEPEEEEEDDDDNASQEGSDDDKSDSSDGDALAEEEEADKTYRDDDDDDDGDLFLYSISTGQLQGVRLDDLESHFYWVTPQGWLLMRHRDSRRTFLWNPFTRHRISLPSSDGEFLEENTTRCLLSHAPTDPNCVVLVVNYMDTVIWYCSPAAARTQWSEHRYDSRRLDESRNNVVRRMRHLAASGGMFYTDMACAFVTLRFLPHPTFTVTPFSDNVRSQIVYTSIGFILLESCGELFKLSFAQQFYIDKVLHIRVEKLDIAQRAWLKVKTLGDRVFLVNSRYRFGASLCAQEVGLKRNCIYFLKCGDKGLYVHNMERGTTTLHNPGEDLQDDVTAEILLIPAS